MNLTETIHNILSNYRPLSLEKMETVKLMYRMDTKYVMNVDDAIRLLDDVREDYHVLEIASQRIGTYSSLYFDTSDRKMFHAHVTGRFPRYKVRERTYSQNGLKFFEIKQKNNTGRTSKRRISISENSHEASGWISKQTPFHADELMPVITNFFERITLINNEKTERVTLDFNLYFRTPSGMITQVYDRVVIVELKQDKTADSPIRKYLRSKGIRSENISKYCIGLLLTEYKSNYKQYKPNYSRFIKTQNESL